MSFKIKKALSYVLISSTLMSITFAQTAEARVKSHKKHYSHKAIYKSHYNKRISHVNHGYHIRRVNLNDDLNDFQDSSGQLKLRSGSALVVNQRLNQTLYSKNPEARTPIASITKLMTAMVILDSGADLNQAITIEDADVDTLKNSSSRLKVGTTLTRGDTLRLALMSSENRAAAALARTYPNGGRQAFINAMNRKAQSLNMSRSRFVDSTGLDSRNVSTAFDLAKMVDTAYRYPIIREYSTSIESLVYVPGKPAPIPFHNTNGLVGSKEWNINVSKTGYINEAGRCLVMQAVVNNEPVIIVLLDSVGKYSRIGDANRVKHWLEQGGAYQQPQQPNPNMPNINVKNSTKTKYGQRVSGHSPS